MRVTVDIQSGSDGGHELVTTVGGGGDHETVADGVGDRKTYRRKVTWLEDKCLLAGAEDTVNNPRELARTVQDCDADEDAVRQFDRLKQYGRVLFGAAFGKDDASGEDIWQAILQTAVARSETYLEIAVQSSADDDHAALQGLRWEALYDGNRFIAAQDTTDAAVEVGVIRLIKPVVDAPFRTIEHIPRILFAVGTHLGDRNVRSGTEFMGIMRSLDISGVQARVLDRATREGLQTQLRTFKPDILHFIGHGRWVNGEVKVQLRPGSGDEDGWVWASELLRIFERARHRPTMVLLSACHTAGTVSAHDPSDSPVSALPFAARLIAGDGVTSGVPVVVAMAGEIADTACRVFTRALAIAISNGEPLGEAVSQGRRAAFYDGPGAAVPHPVLESGHWVMPALFLAEGVPYRARLVNTARTQAARQRIADLDMDKTPIFCGRANFIDALDKLLDPENPLNVLGARTPGSNFGGDRLLRELGARAVRFDVLPVLLGPFDDADPSSTQSPQNPQDLVGLATKFQERLDDIRTDVTGFQGVLRPTHALAVAEDQGNPHQVARAMCLDLDDLVEDLSDDDPVKRRTKPRTILLCHRIDRWGVFNDFAAMLGPKGLRGRTAVPVVFTAAQGALLQGAKEGPWSGRRWIDILDLDRFSKDRDQAGNEVAEAVRNEDILAYLWWLLNPERQGDLVYALKRGAKPNWSGILRLYLETAKAPIYPGDHLRPMVALMNEFAPGNDDDLLAGYASRLS